MDSYLSDSRGVLVAIITNVLFHTFQLEKVVSF